MVSSGSRSWSIRDPAAWPRWRERLADGISYHEFVQYVFELQWQALRAACREHGVMLIGDLPIFVAHDSADVWAQPELFYLDETWAAAVRRRRAAGLFQRDRAALGKPALRVGCPRRRGLFVVGRPAVASCWRGVDLVRIDHFRGFEAYWEIPVGLADGRARGGGSPGPGRHVLRGACAAGSARSP